MRRYYIDIQQDNTHIPQIEDFYTVIHNKLFERFPQAMKDIFSCEPQMEFSRCTWEYGWNMKLKKRDRNPCTLCAREQYFTLLIVTGKKEALYLEVLLPHLGDAMQEIIQETAEGNGQCWPVIDVEDEGSAYQDVWKLFALCAGCYDVAESE